MTRKKKEPNLDELNINELLPELVAISRLGRALASLGAVLTGREKHDAKLVYLLLEAGREYSGKFPVVVAMRSEEETKKYTHKEAIDWFVEHYPEEAIPLLARLEEDYKKPKTSVAYGLKGKRDLPDEFYIGLFERALNISEDRARVLYHGIVKPHLDTQEEEEGLVSMVVKSNKKK